MSMTAELPDPPRDLISRVLFCPHDPMKLLVTSWDGSLRVYDVEKNVLLGKVTFNAPLLDACWGGRDVVFVGGMERRIYQVSLINGEKQIIGEDHNAAIKCVLYDKITRTVISGSWDKTLQQVDVESGRSRMFDLPGKVFAMDLSESCLTVGMSDRQFYLFDVRNLAEPVQRRESSLKYQTKMLKCSPDGSGYASTSIEGRVAVEFFDPSPQVQAKKYAFKCHRLVDKINGVDTVTPVNAIAFHPRYGTFFSGGSDRLVCLWDHKAKKRLKKYQELPHSVVSLDCNSNGTLLAVGCSDDSYRENPLGAGIKPLTSALFVRELADEEGRSKLA